ncbi:MAG TPA: hypothetical protein VFG59_09325 [Anaeromyxobacter sp.]|nr:hypothetical protein [Anaeromyxobacter sp.]
MPPRDPRYRPFRQALWAIYFAALALALLVLLSSIVRHLRGPHHPPYTGALPTRAALRVCVTELDTLNHEQSARAWRLADEMGGEGAIPRWETWARDWEQRVDDLSDRCRLDARDPDPQGFGGRAELARARDAVLALHRAYRAQVNRFAQEDADLARQAARALEGARDALQPNP